MVCMCVCVCVEWWAVGNRRVRVGYVEFSVSGGASRSESYQKRLDEITLGGQV